MSTHAGPSTQPQSAHAKSVFRNTLRGEDAYARHQRYVRDYVNVYNPNHSRFRDDEGERRTDFDVLKAAHRFIRDESEDLSRLPYADQLAIKYYSSLFKEFVICDLKHYKSGAVALRWRTDQEVVDGMGQFTCANPRCAYHAPSSRTPKLTAYELPFAYVEQEKEKHALVKAVLCERCARKLVWKREKDRASQKARDGEMPTVVDEDVEGSMRRVDVRRDEDEEGEQYVPARQPDVSATRRQSERSRSPQRGARERDRYERRGRSLS